MKYLFVILSLLLAPCSLLNGQSTFGGYALLDGSGELPLPLYKNWFISNNTFTGNRTHNANLYYSVVNRLNYWQTNAGVLDPMSFNQDSSAITITGPGQIELNVDNGLYLHGSNIRFLELDRNDSKLDVIGIDSGTGLAYIRDASTQWFHTPSSGTDTGTAGQLAWDANFLYICVATNSWKRIALTSIP